MSSLTNVLLRRWDDLIEEESDTVQKALKRLPTRESYDRVYRIRRAVQCSYQHKLLPKADWTKPEDVRFTPLISRPDMARSDAVTVRARSSGTGFCFIGHEC